MTAPRDGYASIPEGNNNARVNDQNGIEINSNNQSELNGSQSGGYDYQAINGQAEVTQPVPIPPQQTKSAFFTKYELKNPVGVGSTSKCFTCVSGMNDIYIDLFIIITPFIHL